MSKGRYLRYFGGEGGGGHNMRKGTEASTETSLESRQGDVEVCWEWGEGEAYDRKAYSSCSSRVIESFSAVSSAQTPMWMLS